MIFSNYVYLFTFLNDVINQTNIVYTAQKQNVDLESPNFIEFKHRLHYPHYIDFIICKYWHHPLVIIPCSLKRKKTNCTIRIRIGNIFFLNSVHLLSVHCIRRELITIHLCMACMHIHTHIDNVCHEYKYFTIVHVTRTKWWPSLQPKILSLLFYYLRDYYAKFASIKKKPSNTPFHPFDLCNLLMCPLYPIDSIVIVNCRLKRVFMSIKLTTNTKKNSSKWMYEINGYVRNIWTINSKL